MPTTLQQIQTLIGDVPDLAERLMRIHNHAVHYSSIDLDETTRTDLYFFHRFIEALREQDR